jgi:cell wall-associated NlpC family hydrolase
LRARPATESFLELEAGGFIGLPHVATLGDRETDFVATAETLLRAPYLWGGKTVRGVDCSGLVQLCLDRAGIDCPRDTDMQQAELPGDLELDAETLPPLRRGDLVYWPGHVALMIDEIRAIHATAYVMSVTVEPVLDVAARARGDGPIATAVKRVAQEPA